MKRFLFLVLIILLVLPVAAESVTTSFEDINDARLYSYSNSSFPALRLIDYSTVGSTSTDGLTASFSSKASPLTDLYEINQVSVLTFNTSYLGSGVAIDSATLQGCSGARSNGLGTVDLGLIDFNSQTFSEYSYPPRTTFTRMSDTDIPYSTFATLNTTISWTLNTAGLTHINKTANTSFLIALNNTIDNKTPTWASNTQSFLRLSSRTFKEGFCTPKLNVTYHSIVNIYPIADPTNKTQSQYLPSTAITITPNTQVNLTAAKGEYESASFVLNSSETISGVNISTPTLTSGGNSIPSSAIDIKILVPSWNVVNIDSVSADNHTPGSPIPYSCSGRWLSNENLWHNETKFARNDAACSNYLLIRLNNGTEVYQNMSSSTDNIPETAVYDDSSTIQPFTINASLNKQFWITATISSTQATGNYSGVMSLTRPDGTYLKNITLNVRVRNFTLVDSTKQYSVYAHGLLGRSLYYSSGIKASDYNQTAAVYATYLADMRKNGVTHPILYVPNWVLNDYDNSTLEIQLTALNQSGLPKDAIHFIGGWGDLMWNSTDPSVITSRVNSLNYYKSRATYYGFGKVYFYGRDEAIEPILSSQRTIWTNVKLNGSYVIVAGYATAYGATQLPNVADILDTANVYGGYDHGYNTTVADIYHAYGHKVLIYAYPESGLPNPELYRRNYGFKLFNATYDGVGIYAWQKSWGESWNHFDTSSLTDEQFTLPTSNGSIYTLGLQGFREAADDNRYVATLIAADGGNSTYANVSVFSNISVGRLPVDIREQISNQIEYDTLNPPSEPEAPPATTYWTNGTIDYNRLLLMHNDDTSFLGLRNGHGNNIYDTPDTLRAQTAATASIIPNTYADYHYRSEVSMLPSVPEGATVDSAYFNMYFNQSTSGIGATTMCIVDSTKTGTSWAMDDYEKTTLTKLSDDCKTGTTVNELVTWPLNSAGISKITPGGRLTMMLEDNVMVAGAVSNYTWVANENSRLWFQSTNIAGRAPFYNISYHTGTTGAPVAAFTSNVTSGTAPLTVLFTNQSYSYITGWNWTFRDVAGNNTELSFSNAENPVKTFGAGTYDIKLNVTNVAGFSKTAATYYVTVSGSSPPSSDGLPSPTSYWDFNEGAGSTAYDPVGARNGAVSASGASWSTDGYTGGSLLFNGYGTVTASNTTYYNFTGDYTVSMWVNASQELSNNVDFFNNGEVLLRHITSPSSSTGDIYHMHRTTTNPAGSAFTNYGTTQMQYELPNNKWTNIMAVMRGDTMSIYINGVKDRDLPYALGTPSNTYDRSISGYTRTGLASLVMGNGFVGKIDEVKIWNIGLTDTQIKVAYNHKPTILEKGWVNTIDAPLSDTHDELNAFTIHEGERLKFEIVAKDIYRSNFTFSMTSAPSGATFVESPNYYVPYYKGELGVFTWTPSSGQTGTFTPCLVVTNATSSVSDQVCIPITVRKSYLLDPASCAAGYYVRGDGECVPTLKSNYGYEANPSSNPAGGGVNYGQIYTTGDYRVSSTDQLVNALNHASSGQVIYIIPNSTIDVTKLHQQSVPAGVTIASDRGNAGSLGALIYMDYNTTSINHATYSIFRTAGNNVRFTGLRMQGPDTSVRYEQANYLNGDDYTPFLPNDIIIYQRDTDSGLTVDNCEIVGWGEAAIYPEQSSSYSSFRTLNVSYNNIQHQQRWGGGYGVWANCWTITRLEGNIFNYGRHYIAGSRGDVDYFANYNIVGDRAVGFQFDNHGGNDPPGDVAKHAGRNMTVLNNTFYPMGGAYASHGLRGVPVGWSFDKYNWAKAVTSSYNTSAYLFAEQTTLLRAYYTEGVYYNVTVSNNWINTTRPTSIGALTADTSVANQITFNWIKPDDSALDHIRVYKNGTYQSDIASTTTSTTFSGLTAGSAYTFSSSACSGASICGDSPWYNLTAVASGVGGDSTPPMSISGLTNNTPTQSDVTFSWTNPTDPDFNGTMVWINGTAIPNLPNTTSSLHLTGLPTGTDIQFQAQTFDLAGNVNTSVYSLMVTTAGPVVGASIWLEQTKPTLEIGNTTKVLVKVADLSAAGDIRFNISAYDTSSIHLVGISKNATSPTLTDICTSIDQSEANGVIQCYLELSEYQDIDEATVYDLTFYGDHNSHGNELIHLEAEGPAPTSYNSGGDMASFNLVTDTVIPLSGTRSTTSNLLVDNSYIVYHSPGTSVVSLTTGSSETISGFNGTLNFNTGSLHVTGVSLNTTGVTDGWALQSSYDNTTGTVSFNVSNTGMIGYTTPTPLVDISFYADDWYIAGDNVTTLTWTHTPTYYSSGYTNYPVTFNSHTDGSMIIQENPTPSTIVLDANPTSVSVGNTSKIFVNVNNIEFTSAGNNYVHLAIDPIDTTNLKILSITPNSSGGRWISISVAEAPTYTCTPELANAAGKINCRIVSSPSDDSSITSLTTLLDINVLVQNNSHGSELLPISTTPFSTNYYDGSATNQFEVKTNATITTTGSRNLTSAISLSNVSVGIGGPVTVSLDVNGISNATGVSGNFTFNKTAAQVRGISLTDAAIADGWTLSNTYSNTTGIANISLSNTAGKTYNSAISLASISFRAIAYQPTQNFSSLQWNGTPSYFSGGYSEYPINFTTKSDGNVTITNSTLTQTFHIYRTDTNQSMSGTQVVNTYNGVVNGTNVTDTGEFTITSLYGTVNISSTASTFYENNLYNVEITGDNTDIRMTPFVSQNTAQNAPYMREVRINCVDKHGIPLDGVSITTYMINSTVDSTNWLSTLYGMPVISTPIAGTYLYGTTDSRGSVVFMMVGSGNYEIQFSKADEGISDTERFYPKESDYTFVLDTTLTAPVANPDDYINITFDTLDATTVVYLNATYIDTNANTTNVLFFVDYPNRTRMYSKNYPGFEGTNQTVSVSYAVTNTAGDAYVWGMSGTSSVFGVRNRSQGITLKGVTNVLYNPFVFNGGW